MTRNGRNNIRNEFKVPKSVNLDVLHMYMFLITKAIMCSSWATAAIFDLAMTSFVARCRTSTSVIVHVQGPTNLIQASNAANTFCKRAYRPGTGLPVISAK